MYSDGETDKQREDDQTLKNAMSAVHVTPGSVHLSHATCVVRSADYCIITRVLVDDTLARHRLKVSLSVCVCVCD